MGQNSTHENDYAIDKIPLRWPCATINQTECDNFIYPYCTFTQCNNKNNAKDIRIIHKGVVMYCKDHRAAAYDVRYLRYRWAMHTYYVIRRFADIDVAKMIMFMLFKIAK